MSQGIDIQFIKENYQRLSDEDLIRAATKDASGLTPEAQEVVKDEIIKRKLDLNIIQAVNAQNKEYRPEEIDHYCDFLRNLDCPSCGSKTSKLNATLTSEVMSFILFTQRSRKIKVACPNCLDRANSDALTKTTLLGWWGFPWGPIRTIQAIKQNIKSKKTNHTDTPNDYLRSFTLGRIGQIEVSKNDPEKLQDLIS